MRAVCCLALLCLSLGCARAPGEEPDAAVRPPPPPPPIDSSLGSMDAYRFPDMRAPQMDVSRPPPPQDARVPPDAPIPDIPFVDSAFARPDEVGSGNGMQDLTGTWYLALELPQAPGRPIFFKLVIEMSVENGRGRIVSATFDPLTSGQRRLDPQQASIVVENVWVSGAGDFNLDLREQTLRSTVQGISGTDPLVANFALFAKTLSPERFCGQAGGVVSAPYDWLVDGATFGAYRVQDDVNFAFLTAQTGCLAP